MPKYTKAIILNESNNSVSKTTVDKETGLKLTYEEIEDFLLESRGENASKGLEALYDNDMKTVEEILTTMGCKNIK